ncbi:MAG TPA: serine--tRNA ligase, partial [Candidatus Paceibacterota bacterium]|nr:serine--tRNA ligase [Candidatus Paceibacterota bacterium]
MLDIKLLREEPDKVKKGIASKKHDPKLVDEFLALDLEWRKLTAAIDEKRAEQKKLSAERKIEEAKKNKEEIKSGEEKLGELEKKRDAIWKQIPNVPSEDTPVGEDESGNKVIRKNGTPRKFDFKPLDHMELGERLGLIDTETASKVSGSRFAYLKGDAVLLEFAIVHYAMSFLMNAKFLESVAGGVKQGHSGKPF